jgi:hypothetical protein
MRLTILNISVIIRILRSEVYSEFYKHVLQPPCKYCVSPKKGRKQEGCNNWMMLPGNVDAELARSELFILII